MYCIDISDNSQDILPESGEVQSKHSEESFENMMTCLGLSERKPVPEPVVFLEANPLGSKYLQVDDPDASDVMSTLSEYTFVQVSCSLHGHSTAKRYFASCI